MLSLVTTVLVMFVFNHAQPALLYIVPFVLITSFGMAIINGEVGKLFSFTVDDETEDAEKAENEKEKKDQ